MSTPQCLVCHSANTRYRFENVFGIDATTYKYFECDTCKCLFISPLPSEQILDGLYSGDKTAFQRASNPLLMQLFENRAIVPFFRLFRDSTNKSRADYVMSHISQSKDLSILDIGCGAGGFLYELYQRGCRRASGHEVSEAYRKSLYERDLEAGSKVPIHIGTSDEVIQKVHPDVVTMWHVFEHVTRPEIFIQNMSKSLQPGGHLVIETPSSAALSVGYYQGTSPQVLTPEHIVFWSLGTFEALLGKYGFKVIDVTYPMSFPFTTASAAYKKNVSKGVALALFSAMIMLLYSSCIYLFAPSRREAIRIHAIKA